MSNTEPVVHDMASQPTKPRRTAKSTGDAPPSLGGDVSRQAALRAAVILDVLAGQRTTGEAAAALEVSVNHYYVLERKALEGLAAACEPERKGPRGPSLEDQLQTLRGQLEEARQECQRQAALVRATQRAVGLSAVQAGKKPRAAGKPVRKRRRPTVRAMRAAERVRKNSSGTKTPDGLEQPLHNSDGGGSTQQKELGDGSTR